MKFITQGETPVITTNDIWDIVETDADELAVGHDMGLQTCAGTRYG